MHIVKETLKAFKKPVFPITYENTSPHLRMISVNPWTAILNIHVSKRLNTNTLSIIHLKIFVPDESHADAALNKDNSLYFHKILQINKLHRCNQN